MYIYIYIYRIFGTIRRTQKLLIFLKTDSAPYSPVRLIYMYQIVNWLIHSGCTRNSRRSVNIFQYDW